MKSKSANRKGKNLKIVSTLILHVIRVYYFLKVHFIIILLFHVNCYTRFVQILSPILHSSVIEIYPSVDIFSFVRRKSLKVDGKLNHV